VENKGNPLAKDKVRINLFALLCLLSSYINGNVFQNGDAPIHDGAANNRLGVVKYFIEIGVDVNLKGAVSYIILLLILCASTPCFHFFMSIMLGVYAYSERERVTNIEIRRYIARERN